jgi:hypothetical protein
MISAGHQPNYLPWLGFFDKMSKCDVFIIEDNIQFAHSGFTNRNRIKTFNGVDWLTVPIEHSGRYLPINQVLIANKSERDWARRHWLSLKSFYGKAPYWKNYCDFFEQTYSQKWTMLIDLNMHLLNGLRGFFNIITPMVMASSLGASGKKSELILAQCKAVGANVQLSGIGSQEYIDVKKFEAEGVKVVFQDFHYPTYPQLHGPFVADLSVVDYLFCVGGTLPQTEVNSVN